MSLPEQLNHYRIVAPLAKGGMGEVFIADDTRLNRRVALKVLSALMAADPERRQRFEREAQAVAALNHPNIVTIHSVEEANGIPFLTMELVEGKPLGEIISPRGLPVDQVLKIGVAISDAIAAAHQRGITHRDLKPANVVVTPEGRVKVLDFGLAKLREAELASGAEDVTRLPPTELTGEGRIIGTVSYMSPEQAEGKPVDQRTDIFSLGVMLHEMATGERPFKGDTNVSIISAILKDTPSSITDLNPALPTGLARVIRKALAKDPSRRYQTATDLRNDLEEMQQELDSGVTTLSGQAPARRVRPSAVPRMAMVAVAVIAVAIAIAAVVFMVNRWRQNRQEASPTGFATGQMARLTNSGNAFLAAVSPDGKYVAHVKNEGTLQGLWLRQRTTTSDVQIVAPAQVRYDGVTYGPEGDYVYYVTYDLTGGIGTLYRVPVLGGTAQRIVEDVDSRISFSPDHQQFAFMRGAPQQQTSYLMTAKADGSDVKTLATQGGIEQFGLTGPSWSPDGRTIVASMQSLEGGPHGLMAAVDAATGEIRKLPNRWTNVNDLHWLPDGRSFVAVASEFGSIQSQLWEISYPGGQANRITTDLNTYAAVSLSADASALVTVQVENVSHLWVGPAEDAAPATPITRGRNRSDGIGGFDWTADGRLVFASNASGSPQIWIVNADGTNERQLTTGRAPNMEPSATPDGRYIVFLRFSGTGAHVWRMNSDGSDQKPITTSGTFFTPRAAPDGFVYMNAVHTGSPRPWKVPIEGGEPTLIVDDYFRPVDVSPDGRRLLGVGWDTAARRSTAAVLSLDTGKTELIPNIPTFGLTWHPDGRSLAFWLPQNQSVQVMKATPGRAPEPIVTVEDNVYTMGWSPDGKRLAMARGQGLSDVIVITPK